MGKISRVNFPMRSVFDERIQNFEHGGRGPLFSRYLMIICIDVGGVVCPRL